jgi:hypothetical protein
MANTYDFDGQVLNISALDSDWLSSTHWNGTQKIKKITFFAAAAAERCVIRSGGITGPIIFDSGAVAGVGMTTEFYDERLDLGLEFDDGVYVNAASMVIIVLAKTS